MLPSRDVDRVIDARMAAFVEATVQVGEDSVTVPVTLCHYIDYVTLTQGTESEYSVDNISNSSREHITDFLKEFLKRDDMAGKEIIIEKDVALTVSKSYSTVILTKDGRHERDDEIWKSRYTRPEVLKYLFMRNTLLGQIVEKIHCIESGVETVRTPAATTPLERELMSEDTCCLAALYEDNVMRAALESTVDSDRLWLWLDTAVLQQDWQACLDMLSSIPEKHAKTDPRYRHFRDWILEQLSPTRDGWRYCQNMEDPQRLCQQTLANLDKWPLQGCITVLNVLLSLDSTALSLSDLARARELQTSMQTTSKVTQACTLTSTDDVWEVLEELLKCEEVHLALQWFYHSDLINVEHSSNMLLLIGQLLLELLERGQDVSAQELLQLLPSELAVQICESILARAQSVSCLQQIVHFLQSQVTKPSQALRYTHYDIGIHMLNHIPWQEQEWYRDLASQPELLVEQLLMSTRISTLEEILVALRGRLSSLPPGSPLSPPLPGCTVTPLRCSSCGRPCAHQGAPHAAPTHPGDTDQVHTT
ncbi:zinc finger FYVE domain-containing protein 26-like [Homalodisca vitripennis]|uniref:zinc finger FYVE domain-containing protein 26-like n=1 Tax=Homalodisca vitripennis TaxID=197043 RepID=UPI001EE9B13A|nr:zinc finger FYVE domain-containing protein 26-like [Homalodisca vitripennis]